MPLVRMRDDVDLMVSAAPMRLGRAVVMMTPMRALHRLGFGFRVAAVVATALFGGDRRVVAPVTPLRDGSGGGMVMMRPRHGRCDGRGRHDPGSERGKRDPDDGGHASFLFQGALVVTTHVHSCFNTTGTRPGKSSLMRPGPKASAQAA